MWGCYIFSFLGYFITTTLTLILTLNDPHKRLTWPSWRLTDHNQKIILKNFHIRHQPLRIDSLCMYMYPLYIFGKQLKRHDGVCVPICLSMPNLFLSKHHFQQSNFFLTKHYLHQSCVYLRKTDFHQSILYWGKNYNPTYIILNNSIYCHHSNFDLSKNYNGWIILLDDRLLGPTVSRGIFFKFRGSPRKYRWNSAAHLGW